MCAQVCSKSKRLACRFFFTNLCFMQQSPSVTADHDPVAELPLTPKKRMSSDEVDDELGSSQISPAQLSSNKLTRHYDKSQFG